jgi:predicted RNA-binding Zn ribbon-like protein
MIFEARQTCECVAVPREDLCLDFANTLAWRGSDAQESLHDFAALLDWCLKEERISAQCGEEMRAWAREHPKEAEAIFRDAIELREHIFRIFNAVASTMPPDDCDLNALNLALSHAPARTDLDRTDDAFGWRIKWSGISAMAILAPVLWSAGDLLTGPRLPRVRHCANERCLWLFLDDSKSGTRRWCSMSSCGNRAKVHRHYMRRKKPSSLQERR